MALIKTSGLVAEIRGSVGGATFARNRGGAYVRNRSVPLNPSSVRQTAVRAFLASLTQAWSSALSAGQRAAWELYAANVPLVNALGESRNVTGENMYVRANSLLLDIGAARLDVAPSVFTVGPTVTPVFTIDAAADTVTCTGLGGYSLAGAPVGLLFQASRPVQPGVNFYKSPFRKVGGEIAASPANVPPYGPFALPFPVSAGQALFIRTATVTPDGRVGVPVIQRFLVA